MKKMKKQVTDWEKIFTIHTSEKGIAPKIYLKKNTYKSTLRRQPNF